MPWLIFFKTIGIIYGLYYTLLVGYELICYRRKASRKTHSGFQELDTSHFNIRPPQDFTPKVVRMINSTEFMIDGVIQNPQFVETQELPEPIESSELEGLGGLSGLDIENIDNSLNVKGNAQTIEEMFAESKGGFEDEANRIYQKFNLGN